MNSKLFKRFVIDYYGDLPKILENLDIVVQRNGLMMCPMHDNYNTPAAKLFKDQTGWHFYCFNEQRQFGTYDVYQQIYNLNMDFVFQQLWSQLSKFEQSQMFDIFGEYDDNAPLENIQTYEKFKYGQINYQQLKNELCQQISNS